MIKGDKIIWDSGFGYEIGTYEADKGMMYNTYLIKLRTGLIRGHNVSLSKDKIHSYNDESLAKMKEKYGYTKFFNE